MRAVLTTNDVVLLSLARSVLLDAGFDALVFDEHMAAMDGSIGAIPRRLMVLDDDFDEAVALVRALDQQGA